MRSLCATLLVAAVGCGRVGYQAQPPAEDGSVPADGTIVDGGGGDADILDGSDGDGAGGDASTPDAPSDVVLDCVPDFAVPAATSPPDTVAYVDGERGADDPTACTDPASPCATIGYAIETYVSGADGDVVNIAGGQVYAITSTIRLWNRHSGGPGAPTIIRAWPGTGTPVLDGRSAVRTILDSCCGDAAASYVWIEGLELTRALGTALSFNGTASHHNVAMKVVVRDGGTEDDPTLDEAGFQFNNGASDNLLYRAVLRNHGAEARARGVYAAGRRNSVVSCAMEGNTLDGAVVWGTDLRFVDNVVTGNDAHGFAIRGGSGNFTCGNRIYRNGRHGIFLGGTVDVTIDHDTIHGNAQEGIYLVTASTGASIQNTILSVNLSYGLRSEGGTAEPYDAYNLYFSNELGPRELVTTDVSGSDVEGMDPRFVDALRGDFTLEAGSPAEGAASDGTAIGAYR